MDVFFRKKTPTWPNKTHYHESHWTPVHSGKIYSHQSWMDTWPLEEIWILKICVEHDKNKKSDTWHLIFLLYPPFSITKARQFYNQWSILTFSKSFQNLFKIFSKSFQNLFKLFSESFQNLFKIFSKPFQNLFKTFSKPFQNMIIRD
jgi:hypothetical protein